MTATSARIGIGLVVLAVILQLAFTWRWQRQAGEALAQRHVLLREEREADRRLRELKRDARLRAEAIALVGKSASTLPTDAVLHKIRSLVVQSLDAETPARLEVRPGPAPALATVSLSTTGNFKGLVDLAATLSRPGTGLVLSRVSIGHDSRGLSLQLDALALGTGSTP